MFNEAEKRDEPPYDMVKDLRKASIVEKRQDASAARATGLSLKSIKKANKLNQLVHRLMRKQKNWQDTNSDPNKWNMLRKKVLKRFRKAAPLRRK